MTESTKYHPLFEHLLFSGQGRLSMAFSEIEAVLGAPLPPSARKRQEWWSNSASGHSQARAWLRAGYTTSRVSLAGETVDFALEGWPERYVRPGLVGRRDVIGLAESQADYAPSLDRSDPATEQDHPLFGIWRGRVKLISGHDYTQPAFEPDDREQ